MSEALLEAPPTSAPDAASVFGGTKSFNTQNPNPADFEVKSPPDAAKPDQTSQTLEDKPDAMKEAPKDDKPKSRLEKLGKVEKPETKKPDEAKPKDAPATEEKPVDTSNTRHLREAYEKQKTDMAALRAELEKVRPDAAKVAELRAELDTSREELAKLKALNLTEDERKEVGRYRELYALEALKNSPEYQRDVMGPINASLAIVKEAAKAANLSPTAFQALADAIDNPSELARNQEIRRIFKEVTKSEENPEGIDPENVADFISVVTNEARDLNKKHYPLMESMEKQAMDAQLAARQRDKEQTEQASTKEKEAYQKEHERVLDTLAKGSLKLLAEDTGLSLEGTTFMDALRGATPADNPTDRALEVQAAAALPFMVEFLNRTLKRAHTAEEAIKVMNGSKPSLKDVAVKPAGATEQPDARDVFKSGGTFGQSVMRR